MRLQGFLDKAIEDATKSLRLLKRVTSSLMRRTKHIQDQPEKLANPFLVEASQVTDDVVLADKENQSTVNIVAELAMQQSQWGITKVNNGFACDNGQCRGLPHPLDLFYFIYSFNSHRDY